MMKKALIVTTVSGFVPQFEMNNVHILEEMGYEIHYAANFLTPSYGSDNKRLDGTGIVRHQIDFCRTPFRLKNFRALVQLKELMGRESFSLVHCHTPMGGALGRIAAWQAGVPAILYTAHGFHFYKGAPLLNWLLYYPAERFLAGYTHQLICINREDFQRARRFPAGRTDYIPGVGVDLKKIEALGRDRKRLRISGIPENRTILLSVGELIRRKNHDTAIRALARLNDPKLCYVICGHGRLRGKLERLAEELGVKEQVIFLGYRTDVLEICALADIFLLPSLQEGLSVALQEAMALGVPAICSDIRGNRDLLGGGGGILVKQNTPDAYAFAIRFLLNHKNQAGQMSERGREAIKRYDIRLISQRMRELYGRFEKEDVRNQDESGISK